MGIRNRRASLARIPGGRIAVGTLRSHGPSAGIMSFAMRSGQILALGLPGKELSCLR